MNELKNVEREACKVLKSLGIKGNIDKKGDYVAGPTLITVAKENFKTVSERKRIERKNIRYIGDLFYNWILEDGEKKNEMDIGER